MWRLTAEAFALGFEIIIDMTLGYFGGWWLDNKLHSTPWLKWIGFGAGIGAGIKALVRVTRKYTSTTAKEDDQQ